MTVFQIIAVLLAFVSVSGYLNHKYLRLPATISHMIFALLLSMLVTLLCRLQFIDILSIKSIVGGVDFSGVLLHGMLGFLLFAGALHIDFEELKDVGIPVAILSTAGVALATIITGSLVWWAAALLGMNFPYLYALLFGALISPTDPIAVLAILKNAGLSGRIYTKIGGESLFNDGVGVVIFMTILGLATGAQDLEIVAVPMRLAQEILGGLGLGFFLGWGIARLLQAMNDYKIEVMLTLALASGGYALAEALHISAPICIVTAGLVIGNRSGKALQKKRKNLNLFWELIDEILNAILFLLVGLEMLVITITREDLALGICAIAAVLAGRMISVSIPIGLIGLKKPFEKGTIPLLVWGGLRGGLSIAMALSLPEGAEKDIILPVAYIVVLFSILVQGLSFRRFIGIVMRQQKPKLFPSEDT